MSEQKFEKWIKDEKQRLQLKGRTTHFLRGLETAGMVLIQGGWKSKNKQDVQKLLSEHIPVNWSSEKCGIIEAGFNKMIGKFVGVHHFRRGIIANSQFDRIEDCVKWYMSKVQEMEKEDNDS